MCLFEKEKQSHFLKEAPMTSIADCMKFLAPDPRGPCTS